MTIDTKVTIYHDKLLSLVMGNTKDLKQLKACLLPIAKNALVPRVTSRSTDVPGDIKKKMLDFYNSSNCIIMRAVFLSGRDKWEMFDGRETP